MIALVLALSSATASAQVVLDNNLAALCTEGGLYTPHDGPEPMLALTVLGTPGEAALLDTAHVHLFAKPFDGVACEAGQERTVFVWTGSEGAPAAVPESAIAVTLPAPEGDATARELAVPLPEPLPVRPTDWVFMAVDLGTTSDNPGCLLTCHNFNIQSYAFTYRSARGEESGPWVQQTDWASPGVLYAWLEGRPIPDTQLATYFPPALSDKTGKPLLKAD